jgi:hypothetical protein
MLRTLSGLLPTHWLGLVPDAAQLAALQQRGYLLVARSLPLAPAGVPPVLAVRLLPLPELLPPVPHGRYRVCVTSAASRTYRRGRTCDTYRVRYDSAQASNWRLAHPQA